MRTAPARSVSIQENPGIRTAGAIPYVDAGGRGAPLVFLHANGFPPACYAPLLKLLARDHKTRAMLMRPLWDAARPEDLDDWHPLSRDLRRFLEEWGCDKVIAVGHSMGAIAALRAALWSPERFAALVLVEPVLLPRHLMLAWHLARVTRKAARLHPLIRSALRRQRQFDSLEAAFARYRPRRIFRYFSDEALRTYIRGMLSGSAERGFRLIYSPEWEARIYHTAAWNDEDLWSGLRCLTVPTLIVRAAESDTLKASVTQRAERLSRQVRIAVVERSTHLVALERPDRVAELARSFVDSLKEQHGST